MVKKINEFRELQKKKGKKGFSMIELIIVIAIMAILVALIGTQLIPYLEKSREKRDMTTLDTCVTAFESALTDKEATLNADITLAAAVTAGKIDVDDFQKYAGIKVDENGVNISPLYKTQVQFFSFKRSFAFSRFMFCIYNQFF